MRRFVPGLLALVSSTVFAADTGWIDDSNKNAQVLLDITARYAPEAAASFGVEGHDSEIFDLKPRNVERQIADLQAGVKQLDGLRAQAKDPRVLQDLDILITSAGDQIRTAELNRKLMLPFFDVPQAVYQGFQRLLDPRVKKERYPAALVRLRRYAGHEKGYEPITALARARYEEAAADPKLIGPWVVEANQYLDNQKVYLDGIEKLFKQSGLKGWQGDLTLLHHQFDDYATWIRATVLPRARQTSQLPAELYADGLRRFGVDIDPQELMRRALASYQQSRGEIEVLARDVATQHQWKSTDYRDVIRELKKQSIPPDQLLKFYTDRLAQIEEIVKRENFVTLPTRKAALRLASEAESAATPAPHLDPPRLIGNTGEPAQFVIPLRNPNAAPGTTMDDFNYDAIAWTLTAHEARPGHEMQFASFLEHGVSIPRAIFAFNSANVEGWALYAEAQLKQYLPPEGQIGTLQMRMMREARAFLDPMVNLGLIEPDAVKRFLMEEVVLSEPMAKQEVDRYTFQAPGQATSYFYGFSRLNALRTRMELALGKKFDAHRYHDVILAQGLLPFDLMDKAVTEEMVGKSQ